MKITIKILATAALLTSLSANAFMQEYASIDFTPESELSSIVIDENTPDAEKVRFYISEWRAGYGSKNEKMIDKANESLRDLANEDNNGLAMFAIGYHELGVYENECGYDRRCMMTPNQNVIEWWTRADELDVTGQVAAELSMYYAGLGKQNRAISMDWSTVAKKKFDAYHQ